MTRTSDKDFGGSNADDGINKRVEYINKTFPKVSGLVSIHVNTAWTDRVGPCANTPPMLSPSCYTSGIFASLVATICDNLGARITLISSSFKIGNLLVLIAGSILMENMTLLL